MVLPLTQKESVQELWVSVCGILKVIVSRAGAWIARHLDEVEAVIASPSELEAVNEWNEARCASGCSRVSFVPMDARCPEALQKLCWNEDTCVCLPEGCEDYVVLGGTFDHIHAGHKVLLSMSALFTKLHLMIGVSEGPLLAKKVLRELITTYEARRERLVSLLVSIRPGLRYDIVPIHDPFGPSIVDTRLRSIVVSRETEAGGASVNRRRVEAGLSSLQVHVVDLVGPQDADEASKISSSGARRMLLGRFCGEGLPHWLADGGRQGSAGWVRGSAPGTPYVIGLTGGIASGKSTLSAMLAEKGAAVVRCPALHALGWGKGDGSGATVARGRRCAGVPAAEVCARRLERAAARRRGYPGLGPRGRV